MVEVEVGTLSQDVEGVEDLMHSYLPGASVIVNRARRAARTPFALATTPGMQESRREQLSQRASLTGAGSRPPRRSARTARTASSVRARRVIDQSRWPSGPSACTLYEARAALLVALAADRSRIERRPVAVDEVASTPVPAG